MIGFKQIICACSLMVFSGMGVAQNNTNSPYTRYGLGDLSDQYFGNSKAMGGVAYGLRDNLHINPLNPASYTAVDSLTYLFEGGVSLQSANVQEQGVKINAKNSSFDYLAMQFRIRRGIGMSLGVLPYSNVGYNLTQTYQATETAPAYAKLLSGDGGLHQLYAGLGAEVFKGFSLGLNVSYFWGDINRRLNMVYPEPAYSYNENMAISISDYKVDLGFQYTHAFDKKHSIVVGGVFSPKHNLSNSVNKVLTVNSITTENVDATFELPNSFGLGLTYNYNKQLTVGADYSLQQWSKVKYMNEENALLDRHRLSVGAEFIPNPVGRSYLSFVKYRVGAFYSTPYYKINGKRATHEYGVTAGFGLPVPRSRSILSISGQFVKTKGLETNFVSQNLFRVSIGLTFNERWFFKRKVN
ncbi:MAG: hypothetical protein ACK5ND_01295 [Bacteroides sp.]